MFDKYPSPSPSHRWELVAAKQAVIPCLLASHLAGHGKAVILAVLVVPLDVEVGEVDGDPPLRRRDDLPDAVLVARVDVGEGGTGDGAIGRVYDAATSVLTSPLVRVKLIADPEKRLVTI